MKKIWIYAYVGGNPLSGIDPLGLWTEAQMPQIGQKYAYVGGNPLSFVDPTGELKLPGDPSGLPSDWQRDPSHRDPNGERWRTLVVTCLIGTRVGLACQVGAERITGTTTAVMTIFRLARKYLTR